MVKESIVQILIRKIKSGEINPKTGKVFSIEDIVSQEYKIEVESRLTQQ